MVCSLTSFFFSFKKKQTNKKKKKKTTTKNKPLNVILTNLWSLPMLAFVITLVTQCKICLVSCLLIGWLPSPVSIFLASETVCYDQFVFLCKFNYVISYFIFLPCSKCSHAFEVFLFFIFIFLHWNLLSWSYIWSHHETYNETLLFQYHHKIGPPFLPQH